MRFFKFYLTELHITVTIICLLLYVDMHEQTLVSLTVSLPYPISLHYFLFYFSIPHFNNPCVLSLHLLLQLLFQSLSLSLSVSPSVSFSTLSLSLSFTFFSGCLYAFFSFSNKHYFFLNSKSTLLCLILISNQDWLRSVLRSLQVSFDNCISGLFNVLLQIL